MVSASRQINRSVSSAIPGEGGMTIATCASFLWGVVTFLRRLISYTITTRSGRKVELMALLCRAKAKKTPVNQTKADTRLQGRVLFTARAIWFAFALFNLVVCSINLLRPFGGKTLICPQSFTCAPYDPITLQALQQAQIPLAAYDTYVTILGVICALILLGFSVLLFWR